MSDDENLWRFNFTPSRRDPRDWATGDEPVTARQRLALLRLGYRDELPTMTKGQAGAILRRELPRSTIRLSEDAR